MSTLGILAGGGRLPSQLVEACQAENRECFVLAFENAADIEAISHVPHAVVRIDAIGHALGHLRKAGVREVVLAGHLKRPSFFSLRPDAAGAKLLARLGKAFFSGDDALLKAVVTFLEEEGFKVIGAGDVLGALVASEGFLTRRRPTAREEADIAHGLRVAKILGELDIGQAVIVEHGYVLGVEAAEGTDALIERCGHLRREADSGVLVKVKKPAQETRADLPAIGEQTVEKIRAAGLAGIAIEAGSALILDKGKTLARANALGVFVVGVK
ncbi:MAG: UDP-2,3-diacylglucosamine diphosphatase LpxI [Pseudomonadota bacterium]|nr:UDP-2,3-diacylglucosamine diphosphatase LpxI [Pseudomonadota bacterium]MDE3037985.1 UDP-2,3-diacylglucosamine diphosphatase LpxI [Pseudomonadota bacterium]